MMASVMCDYYAAVWAFLECFVDAITCFHIYLPAMKLTCVYNKHIAFSV